MTQQAAAPHLAPRAAFGDWVAVCGGILGSFMAILDISVTNASLPQIQGEIGATGTEGTWISSSYLTAEIIMIPLTAWCVRVFGLRRFLLLCGVLFTACSVVCGLAPSLGQMIAGRVGQGFFGGAMIPTAMTIIALRLPARQQPTGMALFACTTILAPIFGPMLGGWLTENAGWQWLFFLNVPVGAVLALLLLFGLAPERWHPQDLARADFIGIAGLACALGGLTVMLEQGQRERWFESPLIIHLALLILFGTGLSCISQWRGKDPVLKLHLLGKGNFTGVLIVAMVMGAAIYTAFYLIPVFLGDIAGVSAEQTGLVAMYSGVGAIFIIPFVPFLSKFIHPRIVVGCGLLALAAASGLDQRLTVSTGPDQFFWSQMLRGIGQVLTFFPLSQAALNGMANTEASDASGLFNMARNLGGSLGLALTAVMYDRRLALHSQMIGETLTGNAQRPAEQLKQLAAGLGGNTPDATHARLQAISQLCRIVHQQAAVMTYADCFWLFGMALLLALPAVLLLDKATHSASLTLH